MRVLKTAVRCEPHRGFDPARSALTSENVSRPKVTPALPRPLGAIQADMAYMDVGGRP